ncbi:Ig-like domain-containing protein [Paenibacillus montanisoli]|uniref:LTD domain-containing protein n=1 Tax=Paenibacillus montanisoli TaxID=2081970 RepID=A0A328U3J9_9BACL|nr:Ig-like domain-containing protein [Paenibacillus montanisoli]RAP77219.1 hypothetical protein DL346_01585 [Paenibacillus montanisoli]
MAISQNVLIVKYHSGNYGTWVTLGNMTNSDINLKNWKMREYQSTALVGTTWTFPRGTVIKAKSLLVVMRLSGTGINGSSEHGIPVVQSTLGELGHIEEKIVLLNSSNQQVDELIFRYNNPTLYSGSTPFQISMQSPLANDEALERKSVTDSDTAADWKIVKSSTTIFAWEWVPLDTIPPFKVSNTPVNSAINVAKDAPVKITFNEPIFAGTAIQSVTIKDVNDIPFMNAQPFVNGSELSIIHADFENNKTYTVNVPAQAVKDAAGNANASSFTWSFTTIADQTPPVNLSRLPADGEIYVEVNALVLAQFNEFIFAGPPLQSVTIKDASNNLVENVQASINGLSVIISHADFENNKTYTVNIPAQAVKDASGNGNAGAIAWSFTSIGTEQTVAPAASKLSFHNAKPAFAQVAGQDGAVEANAIVKIYDNITLNTVLGTASATATGSFGMMFNNTSSQQIVYVTATAPGKTESAVIPLSATAMDSVLIVKYHAGNYGEWLTLANVMDHDIHLTNWKMSEYLNYFTVGTTWTFPSGTVIKAKSFLIVKRTDGSGLSGVPATIPVVQTTLPFDQFREKIILLNSSNIQVDELIFFTDMGNGYVWYNGISPFLIEIPSSAALTNQDGFERKSVIDMNTDADWKIVRSPNSPIKAFEWAPMLNPDTTPPEIVSITPADGAINVALDAPLIVTFSEPIVAGSAIQEVSLYDGIFIIPMQASVNGNQLLIAHPAFFSGWIYTVQVPLYTVTDTAGNPAVNPLEWSFTTAILPPSISPIAEKILFDNSIPASAVVKSIMDGAVEPNAEVTVYSMEDRLLGTTTATANGTFEMTFNLTSSSDLSRVYLLARVPGKAHSSPTYLPPF